MYKKTILFTVLALLSATARAQRIVPKDVVAGMESTWAHTDSYYCRVDVWTKRGGDEKQQSFNFDFKKPHLIRLKVLAEPNKGADVVYRDGKIRAAQRILGIRVKKGMSAKEPDFYSLRGVPFWEADLGTQIESIRENLVHGQSAAEREGTEIRLVLRWRGEDGHLRQGPHNYVRVYRLDARSFFPLERTTTEDGTLVERVTASNVNLHANFADSHFNL